MSESQDAAGVQAVPVTLGNVTFDNVDYEAESDVLYLHVGDPSTAVDWGETPEDHALRFNAAGELVGVTIISPRHFLERDGKVDITPATAHRGRTERPGSRAGDCLTRFGLRPVDHAPGVPPAALIAKRSPPAHAHGGASCQGAATAARAQRGSPAGADLDSDRSDSLCAAAKPTVHRYSSRVVPGRPHAVRRAYDWNEPVAERHPVASLQRAAGR